MATQRVCPSCRQHTEELRCPACGIPTVDERALRGEDPIGRVVGGKYRIEALLGRGAWGPSIARGTWTWTRRSP